MKTGRIVLMAFALAACARKTPSADSTGATTSGVAPAGTTTAAASPASSSNPSTPTKTGAAGDQIQRDQVTPIRDSGSSSKATRPGGRGTRAAESVLGRLAVHGADPLTFVAVTPEGGAQIRLAPGPQVEWLRSVSGAQVWVSGAREAAGFRVDTFEVRRVNNQPVDDGIVAVSGLLVDVRTSSATISVPHPPREMRDLAGARVWISKHVPGVAPSYGIIGKAKP